MKTKVLFFLGFVLFNGFIQGQTKTIHGKKFEKVDGKWYQVENNHKYKIVENTIIVKFRNGVSEKSIGDFMDGNNLTLKSKNKLGYYVFKTKESDCSLDAVEKLQNNTLVEVIENDIFFELNGEPNDNRYSVFQWYLQDEFYHDSVYTYGTDAYKAWDKTTGNPNVKLAILDTGIKTIANDLNGNIYVNPGEDLDHDSVLWDWPDSDPPFVDNDSNGYVNDLFGWNFVDNNGAIYDNVGHGTIVASIVGAKTNNILECSGVAGGWTTPSSTLKGCTLLICKIKDEDTEASASGMADAIIYAADEGATAINMSFQGPENSDIVAAIEYAQDSDCFVVGSSGKYGLDSVPFPANICFSVGASKQDGKRLESSHYGTGLMLVAPGEGIYATDLTYGPQDGTSFAAPQVAATAGLIKSLYPNFHSYDIEEAICLTAQKLRKDVYNYNIEETYGLWNNEVGYGKLNIDRALGVIGISGNMALREYNYIAKDITMAAGSVLVLTDSSTLNLRDTCKISIYGGQIIVKNGAKLILNGELLIKHNATLTINCQGGEVILNGTLNAETGSSLSFTGSGPTKKMIVVQRAITFPWNLTSVAFSNGKIVMDETTSRMRFDYPTSSVSFNNVLVTSYDGTYLGNPGVTLYNIQNVTAQNSTFEYGQYGLYLATTGTFNRPSIQYCIFRNCSYGLAVISSGIDVSYSQFLNNTNMGIYCTSMDKVSNFGYTTITSNTNYGLYYDGSASSSYNLRYCTISSGKYGIFTKGPLTANIDDASVLNNTYYGIEAYNNATLDIYKSDIHGNKIAVQGDGASNSNYYNSFALNNGYNDLRDNGTSGSWCVYGKFWAFGTSPLTVAANNNWWKTGGGAPVINTDYKVYAQNDLPLTITDNSPENGFIRSAVAGNGSTFSTYGLTDYNEYSDVTTSLGTKPLNEMVQTILNTDTIAGTVYKDSIRFELLAELLSKKFEQMNTNEKWYINHAYKQFMTLTGKLEFNKKTIDKALKTIKKIAGDRMKDDKKNVDFAGLIDEAMLLDYAGSFDEAMALLQTNKSYLAKDDAAYFDELICKIGVDKEVEAGGYDMDIIDAYNNCTCSTNNRKSGSIISNSETAEITPQNGVNLELSLSVVPNPVTGSSEIRVFGLQQAAVLIVYNSNGAKVINEPIASANYSRLVSNRELPAGLYLITLNQNGTVTQTMKMVVVK